MKLLFYFVTDSSCKSQTVTTSDHSHNYCETSETLKQSLYIKATMARFSVTTALCLALTASSSQAFMVPQFQPVTRSPALITTTSNVVLKMNLFDRFARVAKSNLNDLAGKLEDPEKIMEQAIEEMQVSYVRHTLAR